MKRARNFLLIQFFWLGLLLLPGFLGAAEITPFYTQNQSPVIQIFGLPSIGNPHIIPPKKTDVRLILDLASNFVEDQNPKESILLDGESARFTVDARYGISHQWEAGIAVPYIFQSGGFLDDFIIDYHNTFGFPQGGRDQAPRNRILYRYVRHGREILKIDQASNGMGDLQLTGGYQLFESAVKPSGAVALRLALKLPTGDANQLHGSGSTDASLWLVAGDDYPISLGRITIFGAAGVLGMTEGTVLSDQQRNLVGFGSIGGGWSPLRWLAFKVQANAHTSFYQGSALRELNSSSIQLTIGGTLAFTERVSLDLGVTEDLIVQTSPDVVFHLALTGRF